MHDHRSYQNRVDFSVPAWVEAAPFNFEDCPRCGGQDIWPEVGPGPYGLYCRTCQWGGPQAATEDDNPDPAIAAWNDEARKVAEARRLGLTINLTQQKMPADETC